MDRTRVLEIVAAYGADARRWPADEREAALAMLAADAGLRAAVDEAAALDAEIGLWMSAPVATDDVLATSAADRALANVPPPRRWLPAAVLGGSIAASLMAAVLVMPTSSQSPPASGQTSQQGPSVQTAQAARDAELWSTVFTPTPEEEALI